LILDANFLHAPYFMTEDEDREWNGMNGEEEKINRPQKSGFCRSSIEQQKKRWKRKEKMDEEEKGKRKNHLVSDYVCEKSKFHVVHDNNCKPWISICELQYFFVAFVWQCMMRLIMKNSFEIACLLLVRIIFIPFHSISICVTRFVQ
jgi:hypothetical protein